MMSVFFQFQYTLNRLFNNCIKLCWYQISSSWNMKQEGRGESNWLPPEKTTLKKTSLNRVKIKESQHITLYVVSNTYNRGYNIIKLFKNLVKPYFISNTKNTVYVLPHNMPNDLRFKVLESWKTFEKFQNWMNTEPGALFAFLEKIYQ